MRKPSLFAGTGVIAYVGLRREPMKKPSLFAGTCWHLIIQRPEPMRKPIRGFGFAGMMGHRMVGGRSI